MRYFVITLLFFVSLILQSTIFSHLTVAGAKPDLVLILIVFFALLKGPREGAILGLIGGVLQDLMFGRYIGMNAFTKLIVGYFFGTLERRIYKDSFLIPMGTLFLATGLNETLLYLVRILSGVANPDSANLGSYFNILKGVILPSAIYTSVLAPFIYRKFYHSSQKGLLRNIDR